MAGFTWPIKFLGDTLLYGHVPDPFRIPWFGIGSGHARLILCVCAIPSLVPRPTPQGGRIWEITLLGAVQLECHGFWIQQTSSFRSSTRYYSNFQNFFVLPYICFLSLVELKRWLAGLMSTHGSINIPTVNTLLGIVIFQTLPARFSFPRFCNWGAGEVRAFEGLGTRLRYPYI